MDRNGVRMSIIQFNEITQFNGLCDDCYVWSKLCAECEKCEECCRDTEDCDWLMKEDN